MTSSQDKNQTFSVEIADFANPETFNTITEDYRRVFRAAQEFSIPVAGNIAAMHLLKTHYMGVLSIGLLCLAADLHTVSCIGKYTLLFGVLCSLASFGIYKYSHWTATRLRMGYIALSMTKDFTEKHIKEIFVDGAQSGNRMFFARDSTGRIVGCSGVLSSIPGNKWDSMAPPLGANDCLLFRVAVLPECHGKGLGGKLLKACLAHSVDKKFDKMWLVSSNAQLAALGMYYKYGFVLNEVKPWLVKLGLNLIVMTKELNSQ